MLLGSACSCLLAALQTHRSPPIPQSLNQSRTHPPHPHPAETETTTFTDCVNCLIAFTNNPHSLDVSLNAIAFLRFCALALAEGDIGDVEELPEGSLEAAGRQMDPNAFRIRCGKGGRRSGRSGGGWGMGKQVGWAQVAVGWCVH